MIETQYIQTENPKTFFITQALNEVLGYLPDEDHQRYSTGFDSEVFQDVWKEFHARFGLLGCSGTAYRVGQAMFKYGVQEFGSILGAAGIEFRLSPTRKKLWMSLDATCEIIEIYLHKDASIEDQDDHFRLEISGFDPQLDHSVKNAIDQVLRGMAQAALDWASGGKYYLVSLLPGESASSCALKIDSSPI